MLRASCLCMTGARLPFAIFAFALAAFPARAVEIHVAPQGSDSTGDGSARKPFASLEKARDAARAAPDAATVLLHDGTYRLTRTFELDARDSGKAGGKTVYAAAPGARPVLSGAQPVEGWQAEGKGIFAAPCEGDAFRQLFVDGRWAPRARGPWISVKGSAAGRIVLDAGDWPFGAAAPPGVELVVHVHWRHLAVHAAKAEIKDGMAVVELADLKDNPGMKPEAPFRGCTAYLENAPVLLDTPGEWHWDAAARVLRFHPEWREKPAGVERPVLETLVAIRGTPEAQVKDLEFRGITLFGTGWNGPSQGAYFTQFAQPYTQGVRVPGALEASHTVRFAFKGGAVVCAGGNGLMLTDAKDAAIADNTFRDIGCNGIQGSGAIADARIWNNDISRCGQDVSNGGGLLLLNPTSGARIEHNHVHDMPYSGMQIGNQPGRRGKEGVDTGTRNNLIRWNHVHHCMGQHDDGGGIYTLGGRQQGTEIAFNFIHDVRRTPLAGNWPVNGVYLDNDTQLVHVHHNVIRDCTGTAKEENGSRLNILEHNVPQDEAIEREAGVKPGYEPK